MTTSELPHILFIPRWYPGRNDPMLGLFVRKHALAAVNAGYRVSVAYIDAIADSDSDENFRTLVHQEGGLTEVTVEYKKAAGLMGIMRQASAWRKAVKACYRLNGKPALVHAHILTRTAIIAALISATKRVPYIITEHWSRYYPENYQYSGFFRKIATRLVVKNATAVTVVSNRLAAAMKSRGLRFNHRPLSNVVDTSLFYPAESDLVTNKIISITCFEEKSKNLRLLIDAFEEVRSEIAGATLVLVGEGADLEATKSYAASKNLPAGAIRFTGMLQDEALSAELRSSACLALSSNYETFGIVVYEALACGVPVVATDVADLKEFIGNRFGRIVNTGDKAGFANALIEVLRNHKQFDGSKMATAVGSRFSPQAVLAQLDELYRSALKTGGGHGRA